MYRYEDEGNQGFSCFLALSDGTSRNLKKVVDLKQVYEEEDLSMFACDKMRVYCSCACVCVCVCEYVYNVSR
jgi:hypothetical protein